VNTATPIAIAVGYIGGIALAYCCGRALIVRLGGRIAFRDKVGMLGMVGGIVALGPSLFLATVVGGTLGGAYGEVISTSLNLGSAGVPIGLALGLVAVTTFVASCGVLVGAAVGRLINALSRPAT